MLNGREGSLLGASWACRRMLRFVLIIVVSATFVALLWPSSEPQNTVLGRANITISSDIKCELNLDMLHKLHVRKVGQYIRREIVVDVTDDPVPMTQRLDQAFMDLKPPKEPITDMQDGPHDSCSIPIPVAVQVPKPPKMVDASHIDFGVATSVERLNESLDQMAHWAGYTRTRIFALVEPEETPNAIERVRAKADALGINLIVTESDDDFLTRYFALISLLESHTREQTKWACMIDDDTFFLSMSDLVETLSHYDHTKSIYMGGVSEGVPQISVFGLIAFGGGGIFLSRPLLRELDSVSGECQQMPLTGDRRVANCVYQYTTTRLTIEHRLHQLDLMRDASGFFESGREPPLSVHHWKSWFKADMPKLGVISEICGDTCLLRRWHFSDGWILTNGYSIIHYSWDPEPGDVTMEKTWESHNGATNENYLHELGPLRNKDVDKVTYQLRDAVLEPNGRVTQWYVRPHYKGDRVLELSWRKR
ncbi:hypothetical protein NUU61_002661 [Penicillium alfredii]|uniref:Fringe-like glycosyltransferase domain-containing protein n=1 Tax=Penicillium alfredii TaxID=1506179 RepID=A0A9W9KG61_9EURO|nr:uncharacterized protein NUU61_002661 [Penicillium alfredii]KAJ5105314.1 hypothetical protein NUU61_002661 [Penicillium alfredii]